MTTQQFLVKRLSDKGIAHEVHEGKYGFTEVGVCLNRRRAVWHWFRFCEGEMPMFLQSYSQQTGKVRKGVRHLLAVVESIEKAICADFYFSAPMSPEARRLK